MTRWTRNAWAGLTATLLWAAPLLARASESGGEEAGNPWLSILWKFINLSILIAILVKALKKTVTQGIADRADGVRRALDEARQAKEAAEAKYQEYKEKVARLDEEVRSIRAEFQAEGERQREKIAREALEAAEAIVRQTEAASANEVKRAREELRIEAAELAVKLAEEILARAYTAEDQKRAVAQTIQNVGRIH